MAKVLKKILIALASLVLVVILAAGGYLAYVLIDYSRLEDNLALEVSGDASSNAVQKNVTYTVVTQNLGFGAYTPDFTFFMDGGKESWARSKESVIECIEKGAENVKSFDPDFIFFQEVDFDSTRSYHVDQSLLLANDYEGFDYTGAVNYHSSFLMYPFIKPHGASNSMIMTFSKYDITAGLRRSLPISEGFSKFLDLDRCYSKSRVNVESGKELVLYNVHLSAYGGSDEIRTAQMTMLFEDMKGEYEQGNYCVCGGDFNHDFTGTSTKDLNGGGDVDFGWAQPFPEDILSNYEMISRCINYDGGLVKPTCRNCDVPYEEGNFTIIVDGFLVTSNVTCVSVSNEYNGFEYSDHCPVKMSFKLN